MSQTQQSSDLLALNCVPLSWRLCKSIVCKCVMGQLYIQARNLIRSRLVWSDQSVIISVIGQCLTSESLLLCTVWCHRWCLSIVTRLCFPPPRTLYLNGLWPTLSVTTPMSWHVPQTTQLSNYDGAQNSNSPHTAYWSAVERVQFRQRFTAICAAFDCNYSAAIYYEQFFLTRK